MRDDRAYLLHIRDAIAKIEDYTRHGRDAFFQDGMAQDAVVRNLEVIGEAAKNLSQGLRKGTPDVPWKRVAGMRDVLIHRYFGVDMGAVWRAVEVAIPKLKGAVLHLICAEDGD